jgi:hypothetical protein
MMRQKRVMFSPVQNFSGDSETAANERPASPGHGITASEISQRLATASQMSNSAGFSIPSKMSKPEIP